MKKFLSPGRTIVLGVCLGMVFFAAPAASGPATGREAACAVYLTGIGCGNCAVTDPARPCW